MNEPADLFCELHDGVDEPRFRVGFEAWSADPTLSSVSITIERQVTEGVLSVDDVHARLDEADDADATRYACLRGIDRALLQVVLPGVKRVPPALLGLMARLEATGRLDTGRHGGALLARRVFRECGQLPDALREVFTAVLRVGQADWDSSRFTKLPETALIHRHELAGGLRVGCVPFLANPAELQFDIDERSGRRFYRISPRDLDCTIARIDTVLDALVAADVRIAVIPELALSPALLDAWRKALRARAGHLGPLHWLLVGSGAVEDAVQRANTAVLLDARTGEELGRQRKIYPFNLTAAQLRDWKLDTLLGASAIDEDLEPGRELQILDAGELRVAMLVCEDLGRVADLAARIRAFGVSHVLVPVFSRPTKDRRWERAAADVHARSTASTLVISNSMIMGTLMGEGGGTGLVVWPGANSALELQSPSAEAVAAFTLLPDGTAKPG